MERKKIQPRQNWQQRLENYGFEYHSLSSEENPISYWNESVYYEFSEEEINRIEFATAQLEAMCLQLVEKVIDNNLFEDLCITPFAADLIRKSWNSFERSIYGRFDLSLGDDGSIKMLEYNADTPTSLFEAAVAQWEWLQEVYLVNDQFNSIHEKLIEAWTPQKGLIHFASLEDSESVVTTAYMEDVAKQAGVSTKFITMKDIGLDDGKFVNIEGEEITSIFKLYPWEWLLDEEFGAQVGKNNTKFIEPAWKMILSNKSFLPLLWQMFPDNKYLLPAYTTASPRLAQGKWVKKPMLGREGCNIQVIEDSKVLYETKGDYDWKYIYQEYHKGKSFTGEGYVVNPIIGSWIINGQPAGIGIREDYGITSDTARFVPHLIK